MAVRLTWRALALLLVAFGGQRFVSMPWYANYVLSGVEARSRAAMESGDPVTTAILARENIAQLQKIAPVTRDDANYYMLYAANARLLDEPDLAVEQYSAALATADRRPEIYYERGLIYLRKGDMDRAVADLAHAARFNPYIIDSLSGELRAQVSHAAGLE